MARLKVVFEGLGCKNVLTYVNSGNVIFNDPRSVGELEPLIETAIAKEFGLQIRIVLRDYDNIAKLCAQIPEDWTEDKEQRTYVLFLWDEIGNPEILNEVVIKPEIENVLYIDGALVWNIGRKDVTRSGAIKLIKSDYYKHMTIRNINTVRKLQELMS